MKEASPDSPSLLDRIRSWARTKAHGPSPLSAGSGRSSILPLSSSTTQTSNHQNSISLIDSNNAAAHVRPVPSTGADHRASQSSRPTGNGVVDNTSADCPPPAPPPQDEGQGPVVKTDPAKRNVAIRFYNTAKGIVFSSWINVLLIFVPVGIAVNFAKINPTIIFVMNAIAIVPLAGLLSHATESVAQRMGDTIGALMNITFGNAVEIIIFMYVYLKWRSRQERARSPPKGIIISIASHIILPTPKPLALRDDEIPIVQAALLGSILANLLLILGMCFLIGGLRFREQIYNSTVTQMSACLLSLSVMSLLLPTAFHASFNNAATADTAVLKVSRGTSVILLLVYGMYLLFQLKSHAYMYESTPQHIIDEESAPGPVAAWMDSSSSDEDTSSSSDSDGSRGSNTTAGRMKRLMGRRRRRRSAGSRDTDLPAPTRTPSYATSNTSPVFPDAVAEEAVIGSPSVAGHRFGAIDIDDADDEAHNRIGRSRSQSFNEKQDSKPKKEGKHKKKRHHKNKGHENPAKERRNEFVGETMVENPADGYNEPRRVDFAVPDASPQIVDIATQKKQFSLRGISIRPAIPKTLSQNVFTQPPPSGSPRPRELPVVTGPIPHIRYGIRRTNSLPDRLNQVSSVAQTSLPPVSLHPAISNPAIVRDKNPEVENISRTTAVLLLLISTGLVALCANFMVDSISSVTSDTSLGATFVGLILLPIVGNAAEHVTSVTVAAKNKMDLAIGVAVGSSIQIALFITPLIVLLGWCMGKAMTLYFTLFETVSLFVSVFVVNFLVLDGRSNYLEGALLCSAYVIIAVAAFFYPGIGDESQYGGGVKMIRSIFGF